MQSVKESALNSTNVDTLLAQLERMFLNGSWNAKGLKLTRKECSELHSQIIEARKSGHNHSPSAYCQPTCPAYVDIEVNHAHRFEQE